jgi:thioredoxin 1
MALIHINEESYQKEVMNASTPVIIDFWAEWCGPCRMLGPVYEEISNDPKYEGKLKFAKLNTEEQPELAGKHAVQGIPSMIIVKDGKEVDRIVGFAPKPIIQQKIDAVLAKIA